MSAMIAKSGCFLKRTDIIQTYCVVMLK